MAVGEPDYTWSHIKFNAILTSLSPAAHFHIQLNLTAELIWWLDSGLRFRPAQQLLQNPFLVDYYPPSLRPSCSIFTFMFKLNFHFHLSHLRVDLENGRGSKEEGSRSLTFGIYLIIRIVLNVFMNASYNLLVGSFCFWFLLKLTSSSAI